MHQHETSYEIAFVQKKVMRRAQLRNGKIWSLS